MHCNKIVQNSFKYQGWIVRAKWYSIIFLCVCVTMLSCFVDSGHRFLTASWIWRLASGLEIPKPEIWSLSQQKKVLCCLAETQGVGVAGELFLFTEWQWQFHCFFWWLLLHYFGFLQPSQKGILRLYCVLYIRNTLSFSKRENFNIFEDDNYIARKIFWECCYGSERQWEFHGFHLEKKK